MGQGPTPGHHRGLEHPTPGYHRDAQGCGGGLPPLELLERDIIVSMSISILVAISSSKLDPVAIIVSIIISIFVAISSSKFEV